ncbi:hypothetical protein F0L74_25830 [Chitinophaga agrisoli]|uniref:Platelet-activating factor acetylhydrolase n=1 Tax=Chitinophaga agrisoli TaxID=2607653 RepID=A0A5B2VKW4_9BACT|nr:hypothetical protein [Chitinophaga agrisoli]KAA2239615.1 hypothetical protein F0L74_25830 [Chitinophaga agrisoli]
MPKRASLILLLLFIVLQPLLSWSQVLPLPSGKYGVGHRRFEWTDTSRREILAAANSMRKVVADVWYPAGVNGGTTVPYLDTLAFSRAFGNDGLQSLLGVQGAAVIRSGSVQTHAYENAAFATGLRSAPVIFFSHGMGMITQVYTSQIEDLVSHGYIVAALTHAYDAWLVSFSNGGYIPFERAQRAAAGNTETEHIAYENKRIEWWAADIRFALDQLTAINGEKSKEIPFAGYMDLSKVGAMGHSAGGRAAARACQLDTRIKSCADQDGVAMMQPFYPDGHGVGMKQPFLLFERDRNRTPGEEDAASLGMTLQGLIALVDSLRSKKAAALASTGGSFHVLLHFDSSSHMSFSDLPLLQAKSSVEEALAYRVLQVTCRYTREFFDKTLRGIAAPLYDGKRRLDYIDLVQEYPKARSIP